MQTYAQQWAKAYNEEQPPKLVSFIETFVVRLMERYGHERKGLPYSMSTPIVRREGYPLFACEPFLHGPYRKHNGNNGYVSRNERNTPQAFSHFTYERSGHQVGGETVWRFGRCNGDALYSSWSW